MSMEDVATILVRVKRYLSASGSVHGVIDDELVLSDGVRRFRVTGDYSLESLRSAPDVSSHLSYRFISDGEGALSEVEIRLDDYSRSISVRGRNGEQVEGLAQLLQSEFQEHTTHMGGYFARLIVSGLPLLICLLLRTTRAWTGRHTVP